MYRSLDKGGYLTRTHEDFWQNPIRGRQELEVHLVYHLEFFDSVSGSFNH